ncbi:hypothetical protein [Halomicrococcus sp. NG-SE-24]|uniref:hypothetical protein n=1 Tax=Halomicrococcus sp. NG-SE-24 TaxID=3436928 RepID=UPI003D960DDA
MVSKKIQVLAVLLAITVVLSTTSAAAVTPEPVVRRDAPADADGDGVYGGQPNGQGEAGEKNATRNGKNGNERDEAQGKKGPRGNDGDRGPPEWVHGSDGMENPAKRGGPTASAGTVPSRSVAAVGARQPTRTPASGPRNHATARGSRCSTGASTSTPT